MKAAKQFKIIRLLRASRMLRVLRTLKWVDRLQRYTVTILKSMSELGAIMTLTLSVMCIFATVACALFGELLPVRFGNIILTFFTLIQLITLDDWYEIIQEGSNGKPSIICALLTNFTLEQGEFSGALFSFIIVYIFTMVFIIFNLVLAILVNNFQVANDEQELRQEHEDLNKVNSLDELIADDSEEEVLSEEEVSFRALI